MLDNDGRLHAKGVVLSTAGVSPYPAREISGHENSGKRVYHLLRHPAELEAAADSFNAVPVLSGHPPRGSNQRDPQLVVGVIGTHCRYSHPYIICDHLVLWAKPAIDRVLDGSCRGLSCGFNFAADMTPGEFNGERYDGIIRDMRGLHVALCTDPKAGADCRIRGTLHLSPEMSAQVA